MSSASAQPPARISRAERRARTREELVAAADRVFCERGFHGASLDLVAAEAGYTKGAVYSNFAGKEDLFLAVYERRVDERVPQMRRMIEQRPGGWRTLVARRTLEERRARDDGWLAVFHEFWAHVLRNPGLRERFAALHVRARAVLAEGTAGEWARDGVDPGIGAEEFTAALFAMTTGLSLEQLTDPGFDAPAVAERMIALLMRGMDWGGEGNGTQA